MAPVIAVLFAVAAAVTAFSIKHYREKVRSRQAEQLAARLGMSFSPGDPAGLLQQLKNFDLFHRERRWIHRSGRIRNVVQGSVGDTELYIFEYSYVISTGKSSRRISQTVFFANNKDWYLPNFRLKPESIWYKIRGLFDKSDINFHDNPEFSEKYWLTSEFESLVRKTFSPDVQQFLTERPPAHLEGENFYLLGYKPGKVLNPDEAEAFFKSFCHLITLLKKEGKMELLNLSDIRPQEALEELPPARLKIPRQE